MSKASKISTGILIRHSARLECLIFSLLEQGLIETDDISVIFSSNFKRGYLKDIVSAKLEKASDYEYSDRQILRLEIAREGLYDMLPKAVFHEYSDPRTISIDEAQLEREKLQDEEKAARRFFYPFEQEFFRKRIEIEAMEHKGHNGFLSPFQNYILESLWPTMKCLSAFQKDFLFYMLPLAHKIVGNFPFVSRLFKILLKENIQINTIHKEVCSLEDSLASSLGYNSVLGFDFIPGSEVLDDLPAIDICIGPVDTAAAADYLPGAPQERLINLLFDYFMPFDLDASWRLLVEPQTGSCQLDDGSNMNILGFSMVLEN